MFSCRFTGSSSYLQRLRAGIPRSLCWPPCGKATQDLVMFQLCRSKEEQTRNQIQRCVFKEGSQTGWQQFFRRRYINCLFLFPSSIFFILALNTCTVLADAEGEETEEVEKIAPPPGVTVRDVELFKKVQQTTSEVEPILYYWFSKPYICYNLGCLNLLKALKISSIGSNDSSLGAAARCPASIQFGKYDIQTWYSSPYPQEYARYISYCLQILNQQDSQYVIRS